VVLTLSEENTKGYWLKHLKNFRRLQERQGWNLVADRGNQWEWGRKENRRCWRWMKKRWRW